MFAIMQSMFVKQAIIEDTELAKTRLKLAQTRIGFQSELTFARIRFASLDFAYLRFAHVLTLCKLVIR